MKQALATVASTILLLAVTACSTVEPTKAPEVKYRSFSVAPLPVGSSSLDPGAAERLNPALKAAIIDALTRKGYVEEDQGKGDFIVKVHTEYFPDVASPISDQRALYIGFFDRSTDLDIWRTSRGRISPHTLDAEALRQGVLEMLASVPEVPSH